MKKSLSLVAVSEDDIVSEYYDEYGDDLKVTHSELSDIVSEMQEDEGLFSQVFWNAYTDALRSACEKVLAKKFIELDEKKEIENG